MRLSDLTEVWAVPDGLSLEVDLGHAGYGEVIDHLVAIARIGYYARAINIVGRSPQVVEMAVRWLRERVVQQAEVDARYEAELARQEDEFWAVS